MDVANLLAGDGTPGSTGPARSQQSRQHLTRNLATSHGHQDGSAAAGSMGSPVKQHGHSSEAHRASPSKKEQKCVTFELLLPVPQHRARLPMRVMISRNDTTQSIISTVRNFYGLYDGPGVSFQDRQGNTLIANYDNFEHDMTVYVHVAPEQPEIPQNAEPAAQSTTTSPKRPKLGAPFEMRPPSHPNRSTSRFADGRSPSPQPYHSASGITSGNGRSRSYKSQDALGYGDNADGYSSSDGGDASVTSSRRSRTEPHASAEISVDNIVEGGRRKRAKFESSELPLFVPPQVPVTTSISSVSPQRRANGDHAASPLPYYTNQRTFSYTQPLPSPHNHGFQTQMMGQHRNSGQQGGIHNQNQGPHHDAHQSRGKAPIHYLPPRRSTGNILPTPDPTVGSVISDEDVALQLMRLGDASNFSHGRTSTSTADDALSGKAELASSDEDSDADDEEMDLPKASHRSRHSHSAGPQRKKQRMVDSHLGNDNVQSSDEYEDGADDSFKGESDDIVPEAAKNGTGLRPLAKSKSVPTLKARGSVSSMSGSTKSGKNRIPGLAHSKSTSSSINTSNIAKVPMSPASLHSHSQSHSRKASISSTINFQNQLGPDEEDLSSKPRCQRCRKSKKGCDRQRPCGRCKDAGIGVEGCVSEDEGNGRRGRYGRHMGVSVKKDLDDDNDESVIMADTPEIGSGYGHGQGHGQFLAPALPAMDKSKKRKR